MIVSVDGEGTQPYISTCPFSPRLSSHPGCCMTLARVPVFSSRAVLVIPFKYSNVYMFIPNSLLSIPPAPPHWQPEVQSLSLSLLLGASQVVLVVKNPPANAGDARNIGSISGSGRSPGEGSGNSLQYSCLGKSHGQKKLVGYSPWGWEESDMTKWLSSV